MDNQFIDKVKKVKGTRHHIIKNSYGLKDAYKDYNKHASKGVLKISNKLYSNIIKSVHENLINNLYNDQDIVFPERMGRLYLQKSPTYVYEEDGYIKNTYPIDWNATLRLWESDDESYNNRVLIKSVVLNVFKVHYDSIKANYKNKSGFSFKLNRNIKIQLKNKIKEGALDSFLKLTYYE